jgi:hypothetical protein
MAKPNTSGNLLKLFAIFSLADICDSNSGILRRNQ